MVVVGVGWGGGGGKAGVSDFFTLNQNLKYDFVWGGRGGRGGVELE